MLFESSVIDRDLWKEIRQFIDLKDVLRLGATCWRLMDILHSRQSVSQYIVECDGLLEMYKGVSFRKMGALANVGAYFDREVSLSFKLIYCWEAGTRLQSGIHSGLVEGRFELLNEKRVDSVEFVTNTFLNHNLVVPPDVVALSRRICFGKYPEGLVFPDFAVAPYCWHFETCPILIMVATMRDNYADGSTYFYVIARPGHPWYGRCVFYVYRTCGEFYALKQHYCFAEVFNFVVNELKLRRWEVESLHELPDCEILNNNFLTAV